MIKSYVWVVVRDPLGIEIKSHAGERFSVIRGVYKTAEEAKARAHQLWENGERPQPRVEQYIFETER